MDLFHFFGQLEDPRKDINQKYPFLEIIFLTMSAVVSGAEGWTEIKQFGDYHLAWLRKYLPFKQGIPVDDTIARVVRRLSPIQLNDIFINFVNEIRAAQGVEQIAIDGKTLRHSFEGSTQQALHSITVWSKTRGLVLAQHKSPELIEYYEETVCERNRIDKRYYQKLVVTDWLSEAKE